MPDEATRYALFGPGFHPTELGPAQHFMPPPGSQWQLLLHPAAAVGTTTQPSAFMPGNRGEQAPRDDRVRAGDSAAAASVQPTEARSSKLQPRDISLATSASVESLRSPVLGCQHRSASSAMAKDKAVPPVLRGQIAFLLALRNHAPDCSQLADFRAVGDLPRFDSIEEAENFAMALLPPKEKTKGNVKNVSNETCFAFTVIDTFREQDAAVASSSARPAKRYVVVSTSSDHQRGPKGALAHDASKNTSQSDAAAASSVSDRSSTAAAATSSTGARDASARPERKIAAPPKDMIESDFDEGMKMWHIKGCQCEDWANLHAFDVTVSTPEDIKTFVETARELHPRPASRRTTSTAAAAASSSAPTSATETPPSLMSTWIHDQFRGKKGQSAAGSKQSDKLQSTFFYSDVEKSQRGVLEQRFKRGLNTAKKAYLNKKFSAIFAPDQGSTPAGSSRITGWSMNHSEMESVLFAFRRGWRVVSICLDRPSCPACAATLARVAPDARIRLQQGAGEAAS